jgi:hypothetical protein
MTHMAASTINSRASKDYNIVVHKKTEPSAPTLQLHCEGVIITCNLGQQRPFWLWQQQLGVCHIQRGPAQCPAGAKVRCTAAISAHCRRLHQQCRLCSRQVEDKDTELLLTGAQGTC